MCLLVAAQTGTFEWSAQTVSHVTCRPLLCLVVFRNVTVALWGVKVSSSTGCIITVGEGPIQLGEGPLTARGGGGPGPSPVYGFMLETWKSSLLAC